MNIVFTLSDRLVMWHMNKKSR